MQRQGEVQESGGLVLLERKVGVGRQGVVAGDGTRGSHRITQGPECELRCLDALWAQVSHPKGLHSSGMTTAMFRIPRS